MAEAHTNAELDDIVMRIDEIEEARPPAFTDEALALHFAEARAEDLRYVAAWSKWLMWDGPAVEVRRHPARLRPSQKDLPRSGDRVQHESRQDDCQRYDGRRGRAVGQGRSSAGREC